jgi:ABC-type Co2+ transport system permease subunit
MFDELDRSSGELQKPEPERRGPEEVIAASRAEGPPASEIYVQPQEQASAGRPHYPPLPAVYTQAPGGPHIQKSAPAPACAPPPMYGYQPYAQAQPLPTGQALRELPGQYRKMLFRPGPRSFSEEQGKAEWGIIWVQLLFLLVFEAMLALPVGLIDIPVLNSSLSSVGAAPLSSTFFLIAITIGVIVFAPIAFFTLVAIQYLLGRAFQGTGQFKQQAYNQLLFQVPTTFLISLLYLVMTPFLGDVASLLTAVPGAAVAPQASAPGLIVVLLVSLLAWVISIYSIVLNVFAMMAAHRLTGGRATGVVLLPYALILVLYAGCVCAGTFAAVSGL